MSALFSPSPLWGGWRGATGGVGAAAAFGSGRVRRLHSRGDTPHPSLRATLPTRWRERVIAALLLLGLTAPVLAAPTPKPAETAPPAPITGALLQGLDKTTARVTKFVAPLGQMVRFGTLQVTVRDCRRRPPEETPESAAYLDIDEIKPGATTTDHLFSGWMFASSPAVSALEHPVYDVWVLACSTTPTGSTSKSG